MSIAPQRCLVERIAGPEVRALVVVAPGQSPVTYEPSARQLAEVVQADLYFSIGVPFERHWLARLRELAPELPVVDQGEGIQRRPMDADHRHEHAGHHGEVEALDPHIWLAPQLLRQQADRILVALETRHPSAAAALRARHAALVTELNALDEALRERLSPHRGRSFVVFHPTYGYFADAYGLHQLAIELDGKAPSARHLASLLDRLEQLEDPVVLVQAQFGAPVARKVAAAAGVRTLEVDPLSPDCIASLSRLGDLLTEHFDAR